MELFEEVNEELDKGDLADAVYLYFQTAFCKFPHI